MKVEEPGENNVHNNAFYAEEKLLRSELEAMRDCNSLSARHWVVRLLTPFLNFNSILRLVCLCFCACSPCSIYL